MLSMQVHAISSKASDVRSVVVELNANRQAADEAADAMDPVLSAPAGDSHEAQERVNAVTWQDYNEVCRAAHPLMLVLSSNPWALMTF